MRHLTKGSLCNMERSIWQKGVSLLEGDSCSALVFHLDNIYLYYRWFGFCMFLNLPASQNTEFCWLCLRAVTCGAWVLSCTSCCAATRPSTRKPLANSSLAIWRGKSWRGSTNFPRTTGGISLHWLKISSNSKYLVAQRNAVNGISRWHILRSYPYLR